MERGQIMDLILTQFGEQRPQDLEDVIQGVQAVSDPKVPRHEIKTAVLGLLQRHELELTDDFDLRRPQNAHFH